MNEHMYEAALQAAADANGGYIGGRTKQIVIAALNAQACGSIPPYVRDFLGKVQGVCMGVAMSGREHPNPDGALMDLFQEAQGILFPQGDQTPSPSTRATGVDPK